MALALEVKYHMDTKFHLTIFDLPRFSVDINLDYYISITREEMLVGREIITDKLFLSTQMAKFLI